MSTFYLILSGLVLTKNISEENKGFKNEQNKYNISTLK